MKTIIAFLFCVSCAVVGLVSLPQPAFTSDSVTNQQHSVSGDVPYLGNGLSLIEWGRRGPILQDNKPVPTPTTSRETVTVGDPWVNLAVVVSGEPEVVGGLDLSNVYRTVRGVNFRSEPSARGGPRTVIQVLTPGAYIEGITGEIGLSDLDTTSAYSWNGMLLVHDGRSVVTATVGYIADGFFEGATEVPTELVERYQVSAEMPPGNNSIVAVQALALLGQLGESEAKNNTGSAWQANGNESASPELADWQQAIYVSAEKALRAGKSGPYTVLDAPASPEHPVVQFFSKVNDDGRVRVYTRLRPDEGDTIFVIAEGDIEEVEGDAGTSNAVSFHNTGFVKWEGLNVLEPDLAADIAADTTELTGEAAFVLAQTIGETASVLLPGMPNDQQFAPQLESTAEEAKVRYERRGSVYIATSDEGVTQREFIYRNGEWLEFTEPSTMREYLLALGIRMGNQTIWEGLKDRRINQEYKNALSNMNQVVLDGDFEWNKVRPDAQTVQESDRARFIINYAQSNMFELRAHHLVWGLHAPNVSKVPGWLINGSFSPEQVVEIVRNHIQETIALYPEITTWTVVNEPSLGSIDMFTAKGGTEQIEVDGRMITIPAYVRPAFQAAREANHELELVLNKGGTIGPDQGDLSYQITQVLANERVTFNGVDYYPLIDAYGEQGHIDGANPPSYQAMKDRFKRFLRLGVDVKITELDVDMSDYRGREKNERQAAIYSDVLNAYFDALWEERGSIETADISFFGVSDSTSWYEFTGRPDANATLLDDNFKEKPAFEAVIAVLQKQYQRVFGLDSDQTS